MADDTPRLRDYGLQSERLLWPTKGPSRFEEEMGAAEPGFAGRERHAARGVGHQLRAPFRQM